MVGIASTSRACEQRTTKFYELSSRRDDAASDRAQLFTRALHIGMMNARWRASVVG
jgi:hypothetical protein